MFDLKHLDTKKKPNFELSFGKRPKVKYLTPYFLQGGKWKRVKKEVRHGDRA